MREVVIAYDLGTGGIKSSVVSADGEILCSAFVAYQTYYSAGGWQEQAPVRALTITAQNLVEEKDAGEQLDLFAAGAIPRRDKLEKLEKAMDSIRDRYGRSAITLASAVHSAEKDNREDSRLPPTE